MEKVFYITTAIDYPNGSPHMGHAFEKIVSDFYARYYRLQGRDTRFLTGTDENGSKLRTAADSMGMETKAFVDQHVEEFKKLCTCLDISHDDFIRTTETRHVNVVHSFWRKLREKGLIYKGEYTGPYCEGCESFYTDSQLDDEGRCPHHSDPLSLRTEKGHFFKLGQFHHKIISLIEDNPSFIVPDGPRHELLSRLKKEPLKDLSISRPNEGWGIPVPDEENFVIYTWFDALINYYSALEQGKQKYWPASCHVIGPDIIWFHCVIWPSILYGADIPIPQKVYVHGMVLAEDGRKMSKSLGNGVNPQEMIDKYNLDTFRCYILKKFSAHANGRFSESALVEFNNNVLADDYGNLVMRVVKMILKNLGTQVSLGLHFTSPFDFEDLTENISRLMAQFEHDKALDLIWIQLQGVNRYINQKEPWKRRDKRRELEGILLPCLHGVHTLTYLLSPAMPKTTQIVLDILGVDLSTHPLKSPKEIIYQLKEPPILFKKIIP